MYSSSRLPVSVHMGTENSPSTLYSCNEALPGPEAPCRSIYILKFAGKLVCSSINGARNALAACGGKIGGGLSLLVRSPLI